MANLGVTGGIGAGIMQGLQFMRQREGDARQEQALANQSELLNMQKQLHGEKMGELNRANEERMRTETLGAMSTNVESVYSDLPAYQRQQMVIDNGVKVGLFKPADLEAAKLKVDGLRKAAGPDAYDALMRGDILPVQSLLKSKGIDLQADAKTPGAYIIRSPGSATPQTVTQAGLLQLDAMAGALEREQARAATALGRRKTEAEIQEKIANANLKDRLPQDRIAGAGTRGKEKGPEEYDPIATLEGFNKAIGNDPATNQPFPWVQTALQHYQQMSASNPDLATSRQGSQYLLNMATALGRGDAQAIPEIDANGNAKLIASWKGGRKVSIQNSIDMSDPSLVQGVGGNQIVKPEEWMKVQGNAMQSYARSRPDEYRLAAAASADDSAFAALEARARTNPDAARAFNFAKITRELSRQQAAAKAAKAPEELTPEQKKAAEALNIDLNEPSLIDKATQAGGRFIKKAGGFIDGMNGDQFEARIRLAQRFPESSANRRQLFEMAKGDPARIARIQEVFGAKPN